MPRQLGNQRLLDLDVPPHEICLYGFELAACDVTDVCQLVCSACETCMPGRLGHWSLAGKGPDSVVHETCYSSKYVPTCAVKGAGGFRAKETYAVRRAGVEVRHVFCYVSNMSTLFTAAYVLRCGTSSLQAFSSYQLYEPLGLPCQAH